MDNDIYCTECERYVEMGQLCPCFEEEAERLEPRETLPGSTDWARTS